MNTHVVDFCSYLFNTNVLLTVILCKRIDLRLNHIHSSPDANASGDQRYDASANQLFSHIPDTLLQAVIIVAIVGRHPPGINSLQSKRSWQVDHFSLQYSGVRP